MSNDASKKYRGTVRISVRYNTPWRGFTLQRGHFFGETLKGIYFVSALERNEKDRVKVYFCDTSNGDYVWSTRWLDSDNELVRLIVKAVPQRKAMGINGIEKQPLAHMETGFNPRVTRWDITDYTNMHIPSAGRPNRVTHLITAEGRKSIQNYC